MGGNDCVLFFSEQENAVTMGCSSLLVSSQNTVFQNSFGELFPPLLQSSYVILDFTFVKWLDWLVMVCILLLPTPYSWLIFRNLYTVKSIICGVHLCGFEQMHSVTSSTVITLQVLHLKIPSHCSRVEPSSSGFSYSAKCVSDSSVLLHESIDCCLSSVASYVYIQFAYPFTGWRTCGLFQIFSDYE